MQPDDDTQYPIDSPKPIINCNLFNETVYIYITQNN